MQNSVEWNTYQSSCNGQWRSGTNDVTFMFTKLITIHYRCRDTSPILTNIGLPKSDLEYDCKCVSFHNFTVEMSKMADV